MRAPAPIRRVPGEAHLATGVEDRRPVFWTEALGDPPAVYGERVRHRADAPPLRRWEPGRSKLGAALARGYRGPLPRDGERWLYLGAASGTTASHVADLVGPRGVVWAVEKSVRPFGRLLALAERYPNLVPVLGDARRPEAYLGDVPPVDGIYADVAQPDQVGLLLAHAPLFLAGRGVALLALKTASLGRDAPARVHLDRAVARLANAGRVGETVGLEPFHRGHFLVEAWPDPPDGPATLRAGPPAGRRR